MNDDSPAGFRTPTSRMKLVGALNSCISSSSSAICMSVEKRHPRRSGSDLEEVKRLLDGSASARRAQLQAGISQIFRSYRSSAKPTSIVRSAQIAANVRPQNAKVVVLWVSIHCPACARKVGKHISRMEGVTEFSIDIEKKMVTVVGYVTPTGVLESVSRVKRAEFWPTIKMPTA